MAAMHFVTQQNSFRSFTFIRMCPHMSNKELQKSHGGISLDLNHGVKQWPHEATLVDPPIADTNFLATGTGRFHEKKATCGNILGAPFSRDK